MNNHKKLAASTRRDLFKVCTCLESQLTRALKVAKRLRIRDNNPIVFMIVLRAQLTLLLEDVEHLTELSKELKKLLDKM